MLGIYSCVHWPLAFPLWKNVSLVFLPIFKLGCLFFWCWVVCVVIYMLDINSLSVISFANIFSQSIGCLFVLSMVTFAVQRLLCLIWFHLFIFLFTSFVLGDGSKKYCCNLCQRVYCLYFPLGILWYLVLYSDL